MEVYIVYGCEQYEMPFEAIKCFADIGHAEQFKLSCIEHDRKMPPWPESTCNDADYQKFERKQARWRNRSPHGKYFPFYCGYSILTMQVE